MCNRLAEFKPQCSAMILLNAWNIMVLRCLLYTEKNERGLLMENREKLVIHLLGLLGLVGKTTSTGGDSIVKWYMHTHEPP